MQILFLTFDALGKLFLFGVIRDFT
jgi:hypothetical protein